MNLFSGMFPIPFEATNTAMTRACCGIYIGILTVIWMTARAMGFGSLLRSAFFSCLASLHINFVWDRIKMIWTHTSRIAAQVVKIAMIWNRFAKQLISKSMSINEPRTVPEYAITQRCMGCYPIPASISLLDFGPESILVGLRRAYKLSCYGIVFHTVIITQ